MVQHAINKRKKKPTKPPLEKKPRGKRIRNWKPKFCEILEQRYSVSAACDALGISRSAAYRHRREDTKFAADWDQAWNRIIDKLEQVTLDRAINGWKEEVYQSGELVGYKRRFSNALMIFMLKCNRGEKFKETGEMRLTGADGEAIKMYKIVSPDDWPENKDKKKKAAEEDS